MNINCIICTDLFRPEDVIFTTPCGHTAHQPCLTQWMERSKTCPQCRNKCTERNVFRIYFNHVANLDSSQMTPANLIDEIDKLSLEARQKEQALKASEDKRLKLQEDLEKKEKKIKKLDVNVSQYSQVIATMRHEMDILSSHRASFKSLETENAVLKSKISLMQTIESVLTASQKEVDEILKQNMDTRDLSVMVGTLRRELNSNEIRKNELRKQLQTVRNDLRAEQESIKSLQDKLSYYESENHVLKNRLRRLDRTQSADVECDMEVAPNDSSEVDLDSSVPAKRPRFALGHLDDQNTPSPLSHKEFHNRVTKIQESDSPYLKVKSSSIGLAGLLKKPNQMKEIATNGQALSKPKSANEDLRKLSIFKKSRITNPAVKALRTDNLVYNGVGGTSKVLQSDLKSGSMDSFWPSSSKSTKVIGKKKLSPTAFGK